MSLHNNRTLTKTLFYSLLLISVEYYDSQRLHFPFNSMTLFFNPLNSVRDDHMWMGVNLSNRAWGTYYESFFFKRRNGSFCFRTYPLPIALQHVERTGDNACHLCWDFGYFDLVQGLCRWCENMLVTAMSCLEGSISYHFSGRSFNHKIYDSELGKTLDTFSSQEPCIALSSIEEVIYHRRCFLVGWDWYLHSHGPSVCFLR